MRNAWTLTFAALLACAVTNPALAQFTGGGDVPFRQGMNTILNWVFVVGIVIALASFIGACCFLFMRNIMGFCAGVLGVVVGGALMAKAPQIITALTTLRTTI
jgi:hypothetical protein